MLRTRILVHTDYWNFRTSYLTISTKRINNFIPFTWPENEFMGSFQKHTCIFNLGSFARRNLFITLMWMMRWLCTLITFVKLFNSLSLYYNRIVSRKWCTGNWKFCIPQFSLTSLSKGSFLLVRSLYYSCTRK